MLNPQEQTEFNFRMLRVTAQVMCECWAECYGYKPYRGPSLGAIRAMAKLTIPYGIPLDEDHYRWMVREVMRNFAPPIGLN